VTWGKKKMLRKKGVLPKAIAVAKSPQRGKEKKTAEMKEKKGVPRQKRRLLLERGGKGSAILRKLTPRGGFLRQKGT